MKTTRVVLTDSSGAGLTIILEDEGTVSFETDEDKGYFRVDTKDDLELLHDTIKRLLEEGEE